MSYTSGGRGDVGGCYRRGGKTGHSGGGTRSNYLLPSNSVFKGQKEKLIGHIFDPGEVKHAEKYGTIVEEIYQFICTYFTAGEHVGHVHNYFAHVSMKSLLVMCGRIYILSNCY